MQGPGPRGHETWLYAAQEGIMTPTHGPRDQTDSCTTDMVGLAIGSVGARGQQHMHRCSLQRPRVLAQGCRLREQYTSALNTLHRGALSTHILILGHMEGREHKDSGLHPYTNGLHPQTQGPRAQCTHFCSTLDRGLVVGGAGVWALVMLVTQKGTLAERGPV